MKWLIYFLSAVGALAQGLNPAVVGNAAIGASGGIVYLLNEDCEGTGTPSGWADNSTPDWDYATSPAPLADSQSWYGNAITKYSTFTHGSTHSHIYGKFLVYVYSTPADHETMLSLRSGGVQQMGITFRNTGVWRVWDRTGDHAADTGAISDSTMYYIWLEYQTGTGSDGVNKIWINTSDSKPGSPSASVSSSDSNADVDIMRITGLTPGIIWDNLQLSESEIP